MSEGQGDSAEVAAALVRIREALTRGDVPAAAGVFDALLAPLRRWMYHQAAWHVTQLGLPLSEADEAMQRALEGLWNFLYDGGVVTDLNGMLLRMLSLRSRDLRRQVRRLVSLEGLLEEDTERPFERLAPASCEDDDPAARALREASDSHAQYLIGLLKKSQWRAVMALWLAQTPYQAIAEALRITPTRVDTCIRSSLRFLRRKYEQGEVDLA